MVKPLKIFGHSIKWAVLLTLLAVVGLALWLHTAERSLSFAKPWIEKQINSDDAPYRIGLGNVTINWTNAAELGKLRIKNITFAKRDGSVFAQFPEVYATIDPLGFLPDRRLLHKVLLRQPRLSMVRSVEGDVEFGFEDSAARMKLAEAMAFFASAESESAEQATPAKPPAGLPFRDLLIDNATFTFTDEKTQTTITSDAFDFALRRHHRSYDAILSLPFMVDAQPVMVSAGLRALPKSRQHVLAVTLDDVPSRLICLFDTCPEGVEAEGTLDGNIAVGIADKDLAIHGFSAKLSTKKAKFTAPEWFAETLKLGASRVFVEGDWSTRVILLKQASLQLEDTKINATGTVRGTEEGWYVTADAASTQLDVKKIYKYWPLFMAPDSRTWVTGKLKSGHAASGKITLNLTPADFAAEYFSKDSVDARVDARNITFEYLPGFPLVKGMNGLAHFTATTLKLTGSGGTLMDGTVIDKATLWCPELHSHSNPMEAELTLRAPARDVVTMLSQKQFAFDDHLGLDAATIKGEVTADLKLGFNAFSENPSSDPNAINLDAVTYDIATTLKDVSQSKLAGSYDARAVNGTLKADGKGLNFDGSLMLGEADTNDVTFSQPSGKPLSLTVKGRASAKQNEAPKPMNDFSLTYVSGEIPEITVRGKRLDASVSYDTSEHSLLANFPAMKLDIDLGELVMVHDAPFTDVKGTLYCTKERCESAAFTAKAGAADIQGGITGAPPSRKFRMTASNAGAMLKAFDITDRMEKGTFELSGDYRDQKTPPLLDARLIITDFTLKNSQILGRIFAIGSLTGLQNALTGSGIAFEKMSANLDSQAGVITVSKGAAKGASMGITVEGTVDTNTTKLNLEGVVAPAYVLNSLLGNLPIIGAIAGGDEGLIAFNYKVKGSYAEPDVSVNPLSGLTPGFLRGVFDGGDKKPAKEGGKKVRDTMPVGTKLKESGRP